MAHIPRIHWPGTLQAGQQLKLDGERAHHLLRVLKRRAGDALVLFNAEGEWQTCIVRAGKQALEIEVQGFSTRNSESPLQTCLVQAISRGDKMDYTVQKAVELGVHSIQPVISKRGGVQLNAKRLQKKQQHWQAVAQSAAEQSGRLKIPQILPCTALAHWLNQQSGLQGLVMDPSGKPLNTLQISRDPQLCLLIGPEAGFSEDEMTAMTHAGLSAICMGPRILRTETAGVVALSAVQLLFGDLG